MVDLLVYLAIAGLAIVWGSGVWRGWPAKSDLSSLAETMIGIAEDQGSCVVNAVSVTVESRECPPCRLYTVEVSGSVLVTADRNHAARYLCEVAL